MPSILNERNSVVHPCWNSKFGICCLQGQVNLPAFPEWPRELKTLFHDPHDEQKFIHFLLVLLPHFTYMVPFISWEVWSLLREMLHHIMLNFTFTMHNKRLSCIIKEIILSRYHPYTTTYIMEYRFFVNYPPRTA